MARQYKIQAEWHQRHLAEAIAKEAKDDPGAHQHWIWVTHGCS